MIAFFPYSSFVTWFMLLLGAREAGGVGYMGWVAALY